MFSHSIVCLGKTQKYLVTLRLLLALGADTVSFRRLLWGRVQGTGCQSQGSGVPGTNFKKVGSGSEW